MTAAGTYQPNDGVFLNRQTIIIWDTLTYVLDDWANSLQTYSPAVSCCRSDARPWITETCTYWQKYDFSICNDNVQHAASDGSYSGRSMYSQSGLSAIITTYVTALKTSNNETNIKLSANASKQLMAFGSMNELYEKQQLYQGQTSQLRISLLKLDWKGIVRVLHWRYVYLEIVSSYKPLLSRATMHKNNKLKYIAICICRTIFIMCDTT